MPKKVRVEVEEQDYYEKEYDPKVGRLTRRNLQCKDKDKDEKRERKWQ